MNKESVQQDNIKQPVNRQLTKEKQNEIINRRRRAAIRRRREQKKKLRKVMLAAFCVLLVIVGAVLGIILARRNSDQNKKQNITIIAPENTNEEPEESTLESETAASAAARDYGVELPDTFQNPPIFESSFVYTGDDVLDEANRLAAMYDYDAAIEKLQAVSGYQDNSAYVEAIAGYEEARSKAYSWKDNYQITHVFFHTLIVDPGLAFSLDVCSQAQIENNNSAMTTVNEFVKIIQTLYDKGYVLVDLHDIAKMEVQADGTEVMTMQPIYLPEGKTPFVLSQDDVCYYEYMTGMGYATRLVLDENSKLTNEYTLEDGTVIRGSFDVLTILEDFIEAHPDFSYRGARGTLAVTGYNGVFGYRTSDYWYNWNCEYFDYDNEKLLAERSSMYYNNENIEADKAAATAVANAIKELGWNIASHSWGHIAIATVGYDRVVKDSDLWEREVKPIVGDTDVIIFAFGEDLGSWRGYSADDQKYQYMKQKGFDYFCNVDAKNQYWIQIGSNKDYFRQARRNLDGTRMWEAVMSYTDSSYTNRIADLFDARDVFDPSRPTPVQ